MSGNIRIGAPLRFTIPVAPSASSVDRISSRRLFKKHCSRYLHVETPLVLMIGIGKFVFSAVLLKRSKSIITSDNIARMSLSPIRPRAPKKEDSFDDTPVRKILSDLLLHTTDEVESEQLEIKGWCRDERELAEKVAEACACIANTSGGFVLVGVSNDAHSRRKFSPCPHPVVTSGWLQTSVHNLTRPPVELVSFDASDILAEVLQQRGNGLFALR